MAAMALAGSTGFHRARQQYRIVYSPPAAGSETFETDQAGNDQSRVGLVKNRQIVCDESRQFGNSNIPTHKASGQPKASLAGHHPACRHAYIMPKAN